MDLHLDRLRAESFGSSPERYDRSRPSYPAGLIDALMSDAPRDVLDVGCGTGIAGRLFLARGCRVLGVEPDERMAALARHHGLEVEVSLFESWDDRGRRFDLLVSAQAWHWVLPAAGTAKAASLLLPSGRFAAVWNDLSHTPEIRRILTEAYRALAAELVDDNIVLGNNRRAESASSTAQELIASGWFDAPERWTFRWQRAYSAEEWLDELLTHSIHQRLEEARREALLDALSARLLPIGRFDVSFETTAVVARRRQRARPTATPRRQAGSTWRSSHAALPR